MSCGDSKQSQQKTVDTTIEKPVPPKCKTQQFNVPMLLYAALNGKSNVINEAITNGFKVNIQGEENRTMLMLASINGLTDLVKLLLENGATIDLRDTTDRTALMFACTGSFASTVKVFLDAGAQVNLKDNHEYWTPFMFAAGEGQIEVMKLLIDAGADVNALDVDGESANDVAINNKHAEAAAFVKPLMKK